MKLSPHRLTHGPMLLAFAVWLRLVTSTWPRAHPALYHQDIHSVAVPQYISGRTSYLHVRLAFHLYPQLIPPFCNTGGCEPRRSITFASLWPWIAHVVSGRIAATSSGRAVHTRFPSGSPALALVNHVPRLPVWLPRPTGGTGDDDALAGSFYKRHAISPGVPTGRVASGCLQVRGFRVSFIPLAGRFSPFPHGTGSLSVTEGV